MIELFGVMRVSTGTQASLHFRTMRGAMLLAYLALKPGQLRTRVWLCELLWQEDEEPAKLRGRLRWELTCLRQLLGKDAFFARGHHSLALSPVFTSDVAEFEAALLTASRAGSAAKRLEPLRHALTLYKDDLLIDHDEDWVIDERNRLRESFFESVLTRLILDLEHEGEDGEAQHVRRIARERFPERILPTYCYQERHREITPLPLKDFYGREAELKAIVQWARGTGGKRLLTLTGVGGVGKTRLTREVIPLLTQEVVWVSLSDLQDVGYFFDTLHDALKLPPQAECTVRTQVMDALRERRSIVLLLDNLEQIATRVAPLVRAILVACPHLKCLVTSRRPLKLVEEHPLVLEPLEQQFSLALFLNRARHVRPDFASTPQGELESIAICQLLEGIPLALELAAARVLVLGPAQIRAQLHQLLHFLVSIRPQREARHQSLHAAILWSYALLSLPTQQIFAELSVFRGGIALELAQEVCTEGDLVVNAVEELVLHSLLRVEFSAERELARYQSLVMIREFAQARLREDSEHELRTRVRHRECYVRAAGELGKLVKQGDWTMASALVRQERENFRVALESSDSQQSLDFFNGLALLWFELGLWSDFDQLVQKTEKALETEPDSLRTARIWGLRAGIARRRGRQDEAWRHWEQRLEVYQRLELPDQIVGTLLEMTGQAIDEHKSILAQRFLRSAEQVGEAGYSLELSVLQTRLAFLEGDLKRTQSLLRALVRQLQEGEVTHQARIYALHYLSSICRSLGFIPELEWMLHEGLALNFAESRLFNLGVLVLELARHREQQGELERAGAAYYVAQEIHKELQSRLQNEAAAALESFVARHLAGEGLRRLTGMSWRSVFPNLTSEE